MTVFDRPSASELLDAVIDFINAETKSEDFPANKRFKLQIVSNVLSIVKRELDLGKEINEDFSMWVNMHNPFYEVLDFIEKLKNRDIKTGIITTKGKTFTEKILQKLNIHPDFIYGYEYGT